MKNRRSILYVLIIGFYAETATANAALPAIALEGPFLLALLLPIILLEAVLIKRKMHLGFGHSLQVVTVANIASTIAGAPIAFGLVVLYQFGITAVFEWVASPVLQDSFEAFPPIWQGVISGIMFPMYVMGIKGMGLPSMIIAGVIFWTLCFLISWPLEFQIARLMLKTKTFEVAKLNSAFKQANLCSYACLVVFWLGYTFFYMS